MQPPLTVFVVNAVNRTTNKLSTFLVQAENHRLAWQVARHVAKTGDGALYRDASTGELHEFPIEPSSMTVTRVLTTEKHRRGRPARVLVDDLLALAHERSVNVPPRIRRVLSDLHA